MIVEFSQPVKYSAGVDPKKIITLSISDDNQKGPQIEYDFDYSISYWEPNQY
jgi:hypothetical protein